MKTPSAIFSLMILTIGCTAEVSTKLSTQSQDIAPQPRVKRYPLAEKTAALELVEKFSIDVSEKNPWGSWNGLLVSIDSQVRLEDGTQIYDSATCNAVLVKENLIATAAHCLPKDALWNEDYDCKDSIAFRASSDSRGRSCVRIVYHSDWQAFASNFGPPDIALLEIEATGPEHNKVKLIDFNPKEREPIFGGQKLWLLGLEINGKEYKATQRLQACEVTDRSIFLPFFHRHGPQHIIPLNHCYTEEGVSGAAYVDSKGELKAIHSSQMQLTSHDWALPYRKSSQRVATGTYCLDLEPSVEADHWKITGPACAESYLHEAQIYTSRNERIPLELKSRVLESLRPLQDPHALEELSQSSDATRLWIEAFEWSSNYQRIPLRHLGQRESPIDELNIWLPEPACVRQSYINNPDHIFALENDGQLFHGLEWEQHPIHLSVDPETLNLVAKAWWHSRHAQMTRIDLIPLGGFSYRARVTHSPSFIHPSNAEDLLLTPCAE